MRYILVGNYPTASLLNNVSLGHSSHEREAFRRVVDVKVKASIMTTSFVKKRALSRSCL